MHGRQFLLYSPSDLASAEAGPANLKRQVSLHRKELQAKACVESQLSTEADAESMNDA